MPVRPVACSLGLRAGLSAPAGAASFTAGRGPRSCQSDVPRSWVPSTRRYAAQTGLEHVEHEDNRPSRDFEWFRRVDDNGVQTLRGISRSIRPGTAVPPTVLVSDMGNGILVIEGWREGPSTYLCSTDAAPLRRELVRAFGSTDLTLSGGQGEAR